MAKEKQTDEKRSARIYSALLTVPPDDGNFKSALNDESADAEMLRKVLSNLPQQNTITKRKILESRLRKLEKNAPVAVDTDDLEARKEAAKEKGWGFIRIGDDWQANNNKHGKYIETFKMPLRNVLFAVEEWENFWTNGEQVIASPLAIQSIETVREIEVNRIAPSRFEPQARRRAHFTDEDLQSLADSIKTRGLRQPILVRPLENGRGDFEVVFGERRLLATRKAGFDKIRCFVEALTDAETVELQYEENHQRKKTNPLDDTFVFKFLIDRENYSPEQLADRFNKKLSEVEDLLALGDLYHELAREFDEGLLPMKHAVYLAKFFSLDVQAEIYKEALAYQHNERKYGAVSFRIFREEVEENFVRLLSKAPFDTEDERLYLKGQAVSLKCSGCSQRTGFNTLFREISENDSCLNRACFQFKTNVHLRLQREAIAEQQNYANQKPPEEAVKDVPLVTDRKYVADRQPFKEKVQTEVEIFDDPECAFSVLALAVEGSRKGQKVWICENKEKGEHCAVHNPPPARREPDAETIAKEQRILNEKVREQLREKIFSKAIEAFDDYTPVWQYADLINALIYNLFVNCGFDTKKFVCQIGGFDLPTGNFTPGEVLESIGKLNRADQSRVIFLLLTAKHGFLPGDESVNEIRKIAKDYASLDYDALEVEIRLELTPVEAID